MKKQTHYKAHNHYRQLLNDPISNEGPHVTTKSPSQIALNTKMQIE